MPFLRAALLKKKLAEQPEPEQEEILRPNIIVEEQKEPEEEIEASQFDTLRGILDERDKEADTVLVVVDDVQHETEIPVVEISAVEIPVAEVQIEEPVTEILTAEETQGPQADLTRAEVETEEPETAEEVFTETAETEADEPQGDIVIDTDTVIEFEPETETEYVPETLPDLVVDSEIEIIPEHIEAVPDETVNEILTVEPEITEPHDAEPETESESETAAEQDQQEQEVPQQSADDFDENSLLDEPSAPEPELETETESESEAEAESESEPETESQPESESETHEPESGSEDFALKYDFTSGERYVDKVSTKTEFDKMLDELAEISRELLSWQTDKFARDFTDRFQEETQAEARKYEAFLGGYITNAAMLLYDKGYRDAALKQLEQAKSILEARKKLEDETSAIKSRVEEQNDVVDLSDILGLFGDG